MDSPTYKVIFKGLDGDQSRSLTLTFKGLQTDHFIKIPPDLLPELKEKSSSNIINFQNIGEVLSFGNEFGLNFNYYIVILLIKKQERELKGFLIGNTKDLGDIIIGIWPFTESFEKTSIETLSAKISKLHLDYEQFEKICVIYS